MTNPQTRADFDKVSISNAASFSVYLRLSAHEFYQKKADSIPAAQDIARELIKLSKFGRRPIIYAITKEGYTIPLDPKDQIS